MKRTPEERAFRRGVVAAARVADTYGSSYRYRIGDCILGKLNQTSRKTPRTNPSHMNDWIRGFAIALSEINRILDAPSAVGETLRNAGITMAALKRAGVEEYDLTELAKCLPLKRAKETR